MTSSKRSRAIRLLETLFPPLVIVHWPVAFRQFLGRAIARQYRANAFGFLWAILVPLFTLALYTFVFGVVMQSRWSGAGVTGETIPFSLYLFAGLVVFWLMSQSMAECCSAIVNHANLVKKAVFPLEIIPVTTVGSALFHTLVNTAILLLAVVALGGHVPATALLFPIVLLPFVLLLMGIAWLLSALGVFFRDLGPIVGLLMTGAMFMSPVLYAIDRLSPKLQRLIQLNPVTFIVVQGRRVLLEGQEPNWIGLAWYFVIAWIVASIGLIFFRFVRKSFADVL